jgi:hypothetical protein
VARPVLLRGFQWQPIAILVSAWVMGSGLFFFLAGRPLRWSSIAMCLFWILAGAAGDRLPRLVPPGTGQQRDRRQRGPVRAGRPPGRALVAFGHGGDARAAAALAARAPSSWFLRDRSAETAFKQSYLLAANGIKRLSPAEAKELGELTSAVYAPAAPPNRKRLDGYMERVRGLQVTQPQEDREMTALVREAVLQFPEPQRTRYQLLYEKALGVGR